MLELINNLQAGCCTNNLTVVNHPVVFHAGTTIKLYDTIADAANLTNNYRLFPLIDIISLNNAANKRNGIPYHPHPNGCVISLRIDIHQNTRFCMTNAVELL